TARVEAEPEIVDALVTRCAGLPLALGILAARAAAQPSTPLAAFADELADRLDALDTGDLGLREIFSWSVKALTDDAARLFRLLGLHPGPDFDLHAAANLLGVDDRSCRKLLTELVNAHLVERYQPTRYRLHDLLRDYAAELAAREPGRSEALGRMFDFYLHTAWAADRAIVEHRLPVAIADAAKGVRPLSFADRPLAITWCQIEHPVLSGMVQRALDTGFDSHSWRLAMALRSYFDTAGHWHDYASVYRVAKIAVDRAANPAEQVRVHRGLGRGLSRLNLWDPAESALGDSLRYAIQSRDSIQRSHTHEAFSWLYSMAGMHDQALDHAIRGLALYVEGEHSRWRAFALNIAGRCHAALGQLDQALALSSEALALHLELDDRTGEAEALDNVGHVLHRLGSTAEALDHCQRALDLYIKLRNIPGQADTLEHLGDIHAAKGDFATAKAEWTEAVAILDRLSHPRADAVRTKIEAPPPAHPSSV
ncbi:MAG: tetratricopeptide repeat protein, partial [Umezawaea sp.]